MSQEGIRLDLTKLIGARVQGLPVGAAEHDAVVRRRRAQDDTDGPAAVQADAAECRW